MRIAKQIIDEMVESVSAEEWCAIQKYYNTSVEYSCLPDLLDVEIPKLQLMARAALELRRETNEM